MDDEFTYIYVHMQDVHLIPDIIFEKGWKGTDRDHLVKMFATDSTYMYIRYSPSLKTIVIFFTPVVDTGISFRTQEAKDILLNILLEN